MYTCARDLSWGHTGVVGIINDLSIPSRPSRSTAISTTMCPGDGCHIAVSSLGKSGGETRRRVIRTSWVFAIKTTGMAKSCHELCPFAATFPPAARYGENAQHHGATRLAPVISRPRAIPESRVRHPPACLFYSFRRIVERDERCPFPGNANKFNGVYKNRKTQR